MANGTEYGQGRAGSDPACTGNNDDRDRGRAITRNTDTRTVARLLVELKNDRDRFDGRTVVMIDEAGTLGAAQARELFEQARDAGSRVMLLVTPRSTRASGGGACCGV